MFRKNVFGVCKRIPLGKVVSYKQIGEEIGSKAYRAIGVALSKNNSQEVPCHRVVGSDGRLVGFKGSKNTLEKEQILEKEGVEVVKGKIAKKYFYDFSTRK
jgi:methylated-DNA-[protein]-cysteine S-methyltransferase